MNWPMKDFRASSAHHIFIMQSNTQVSTAEVEMALKECYISFYDIIIYLNEVSKQNTDSTHATLPTLMF